MRGLCHSRKNKENGKKLDKFLDLAQELKHTVEHEGNY